jgi:hypothetical protein
MREHTYLQEEEMIRRAIHALMESLGPIETARFLALPRQRRLNSVLRHRKWQASLDKGRFFDQVFGAKQAPGNPGP